MNDVREFVNRLGESDTLFTGPYQATYFDHDYSKNQHCSEQIMTLQFDKKYMYGDDARIDIYRNGDILQALYLQLTFATPGIPVVDSLGTYVIEYARLLWEDHVIEEIFGEHLEMMNDLTVPQSKQGALGQLTGKNRTTMNSMYSIKLPFDCFKHGLPLCALRSDPYLQIKFRPANSFAPSITAPLQLNAKLIVNYAFLPSNQREYLQKNRLTYRVEQTHRTNVQVAPVALANKTNVINVTSNVNTTGTVGAGASYFGVPVPYDFISHSSSNITVQVTSSPATTTNFTFLLNGVSATVASSTAGGVATFVYAGPLTYGTTANVTVQWTGSETPTRVACTFAGSYFTNECVSVPVYTSFVYPVKEFFIAIQNSNTTSSYDYTYDGTNGQIVNMRMMFNGYEVIPATLGTSIFLRALQGLENYTRSPDRKFYLYPFAIDPENSLPTGSINMSALTRQQFDFALRYTNVARDIRIYARLHNVMTVNEGVLKVLYDEVVPAAATIFVSNNLSVTNFTTTNPRATTMDLTWTSAPGATTPYSIISSPATTIQTTTNPSSYTFTGLTTDTVYTFTLSNFPDGSITSLPVATRTNFTFTTLGSVGPPGPTSLAGYGTTYPGYGTSSALTLSGGIQYWTVVRSGTYTFTVAGAGSYNSTTTNSVKVGYGAVLTASYYLTAGQVIAILVGQMGAFNGSGSPGADGSGGTFVVSLASKNAALSTGIPLFVAGGAGGPGDSANVGANDPINASLTPSGRDADGGTGGTNGYGGISNPFVPFCESGAGFYGNGSWTTRTGSILNVAKAFINGGIGGTNLSGGGFGGGGSVPYKSGGGGGGGYSGGGNAVEHAGGGGGGTYDITGAYSCSATNSGPGYVTIVY